MADPISNQEGGGTSSSEGLEQRGGGTSTSKIIEQGGSAGLSFDVQPAYYIRDPVYIINEASEKFVTEDGFFLIIDFTERSTIEGGVTISNVR